MLLDVVIVLLLILLNGVFAMAEMAVVSARKSRLKPLAETSAGARAALALAEQPTRFLSTIQIGISTVGILAGAFGGATVAEQIELLAKGTAVERYGEAIGVAIVVTVITFLSLILGELIPKRIALAHPEAIATALAPFFTGLSRLSTPLVWALSATSDGLLRLFHVPHAVRSTVTEEEIRHLVEEGARSGAIERVERDMVDRVFRLGDKNVDDIMTPRSQIVWLDADAPPDENLDVIRKAPHARFPVMRGGNFEPVGIVQIKDLVLQQCAGRSLELFATVRKPLFVPETTRAVKLLEMFKASDMHLALVVDEYGAVSGLVTLNDILEAIVGEVPTAEDRRDPAIVKREDGSYLVDGMLPADGIKELLALPHLVQGGEHDFNTLAGMVIAHLGRIPVTGDHFHWHGWRFEVVDMDGPRVDKVLVGAAPPAPDAPDRGASAEDA